MGRPERRAGPDRGSADHGLAAAAGLVALVFGVVLAGAGLVAAQTADLAVAPNPAHPGEPVRLDGRNSTAEGSIVGCEFDVDGDGQYERQSDTCVVEHAFEAAAEYEVGLRIITATDRQDTDAVALSVVANEPPEPAIAVEPTSPRPEESIVLSGADSADADGRVVAYTWTLPGRNASGETVSASVTDPGQYDVALTVTDDDGASASSRTTIEVAANEPPTAALSVSPASVEAGDRLLFDAGGSTDREGAIVGYRWDLDGDGSIDARTETDRIEYEPGGPGEHEPSVIVVDDRGATDTFSASYTVGGATPTRAMTTVQAADPTPSTSTSAETDEFPVPPMALGVVLLFVLLLVAGVGVGVRRRDLADEAADTLRELLTRGDVRRRLARTLSRTVVKNAAKRAVRRFSDAIDAAGDAVGEVLERAGRAIKRGSSRLAAWLRRLGS